MSQDGQCPPDDRSLAVVTFSMPRGLVFDWHVHDDHQIAWARSGVLTVRIDSTAWVLPPTRALWIPAGVRHETLSSPTATMQTIYVRPDRCAISWGSCTPVAVEPLLAHLIDRLAKAELDPGERSRSEGVVVDLLRPVSMASMDVPVVYDERARDVAEALHADPADPRSLREWGHEIGASERTLARSFLADTGLSFGRWRTRLRLSVALCDLASGAPVSTVAHVVGYESASAFVAAFRRETGVTPAVYFRTIDEA